MFNRFESRMMTLRIDLGLIRFSFCYNIKEQEGKRN